MATEEVKDASQPPMSDMEKKLQAKAFEMLDTAAGKSSQTNEEREAQARSYFYMPDGSTMTSTFAEILTCLFSRFSAGSKGLSMEKLFEFSKACNVGRPFSKEEVAEIPTYFTTNDAGELTQRGFLDMYHTQTNAEPLETWRDFVALGYAESLIDKSTNMAKSAAAVAAAYHKAKPSSCCFVCKTTYSSLFNCSACKAVSYCSKACQRTHWKSSHKSECCK